MLGLFERGHQASFNSVGGRSRLSVRPKDTICKCVQLLAGHEKNSVESD